MVSTSETEEGKRLAESLVKNLTGRDSISAQFLRWDYFTFQAMFKLWLAANQKPTIGGTDRAIWDRIRLVPFSVRIVGREWRDGYHDGLELLADVSSVVTD